MLLIDTHAKHYCRPGKHSEPGDPQSVVLTSSFLLLAMSGATNGLLASSSDAFCYRTSYWKLQEILFGPRKQCEKAKESQSQQGSHI